MASENGQSLIEVALALPLLLVLLLGVVDGARAYHFAGLMATAAREGANYAARNGTATSRRSHSERAMRRAWSRMAARVRASRSPAPS